MGRPVDLLDCRLLWAVNHLGLRIFQPDLGGLGLQNLVRHPGAQERHLAASRFWAARIGSGIPQPIGYGPDRRLWNRLTGAACLDLSLCSGVDRTPPH